LDYLLSRLQHCNIVLVEGFKHGEFPKLEVWRPSLGVPMLWPQWPGIGAIASDGGPPKKDTEALQGVPVWLELSATPTIADFVLEHARESDLPAS